ncbi:MAG: TdeIII family type II restriction endonuclease, partial [Chloroflexota bacterium]
MPLSKEQSEEIRGVLTDMIRRKLAGGKKKPSVMPFQVHLLGKDRVALFSFIHSISTSLGQDFFENTAEIVARPHFARVLMQYNLGKAISADALRVIQTLIDAL